MDYEKKYNEALERANKQRADYQKELDKTDKNSQLAGLLRAGISAIDMAFPELAESEDERIRRTLVEYFGPKVQLDFVRGIPIQKIRDWLEKQKEQKPLETPSPSVIYTEQGEVLAEQKPAERSEEDESMRWNIISVIGQSNCVQADDMIDWLKSPRPPFKPSEEQMKALYEAAQDAAIDREGGNALYELYEHLKRL